ncbi:MAG: GNAT family N-acetyltransferase [Candidatus Thorarchaeota archaeon]|nr:GNAT family N-acetyltransferase [Candidatus Thorarchaeota archaeon]
MSGFYCKNEDINDFIHHEAKDFQNERLGVSYLFRYDGELVGFVTLSMADLRKERMGSEDRLQVGKENYPALQIGQLAVCDGFEGRGIGTFLCDFSLGKAYEFSEKVGCRFLVLNAKREVMPFYEKYGFKSLPKQEKRIEPVMFLNIFNKKATE